MPHECMVRHADRPAASTMIQSGMHESHMVNPIPVVHVDQLGKLGNRMLQAMAAIAIARRVERCVLSGIDLPEWGISHPTIRAHGERTLRLHSDRLMRLKVDRLIRQQRGGELLRLEIACYAQHFSNFLPAADYRAFFPDTIAPDTIRGAGPSQLLINIRGGDILRDAPADYTLLPIEFYAGIIRETGLDPIFMGQTEPNPYMDRLRRAFPSATILASQGPMRDFAMIRRSRNIVVSVSTFSWLAAWLSHADRIILPLTGFYNPVQSPAMDLIPRDDPRYEFHLFPINYAVPVERHEPVHRSLIGNWRRIGAPEIDAIRGTTPRVPVDVQKYWEVFDEGFYLSAYAAIAKAVADKHFANGLAHYQRHGMWEQLLPLRFDRIWYGMTYPDAAVETACGDYVNLLHHYVEAGRAAGYRPAPPPGDPTPPFAPQLP